MLSVCFLANAQSFRYIVATDGSGDFTTVQAAIDACPDNERSIVFVKNGTYYGATSIGSKTVASLKIISLIGESQDSVILTYDKWLGTTNGGVSTFELATTFQIYAKNFYAENITFQNSSGNKGQALALYTAGDMSIFKNCKLLGYQDTYRSKKGTRGYLKDCWIEGGVDFIYAGGTLFFDDCTINCTKEGGFVAAPEDAFTSIPKTSTQTGIFIRLGFIFRNCLIKGADNVAANTFYLGRPWGDYAGAIYLNCKLTNQVNTAGWSTMGASTYLTSCFAEYNSMDINGIPIDITKRISWSYQLKQADVDNHLTTTLVYARNYTTVFDPITSILQTSAPTNLSVNNLVITWDNVPNAIAYVIYSNNKFIGVSSTNSYTTSGATSSVFVRAINVIGVLSEKSQILSSIPNVLQKNTLRYQIINKLITFEDNADVWIYATNGSLIKQSTSNTKQLSIENINTGIYVLIAKAKNGNVLNTTISIH